MFILAFTLNFKQILFSLLDEIVFLHLPDFQFCLKQLIRWLCLSDQIYNAVVEISYEKIIVCSKLLKLNLEIDCFQANLLLNLFPKTYKYLHESTHTYFSSRGKVNFIAKVTAAYFWVIWGR